MKKWATLFISLILVLSMVSAALGEEATVAKFDPPITITAVRTAPNAATVQYPEGETMEDNVWTRMYLEELGINLQYKWLVDEASWNEKVNLMIASTDLPDIFQATDIQFQQLYEAGLLVDQTEAFEKYATEYTKMVIFESGDGQYNSALRDGKLMAIPFTGNPRENVPFLVVRKDWEKQLGLDGIDTWDDVVEYAAAFKGMADGNYGLTSTSDLGSLYTLFAAFGSYPQKWIEQEDGTLVYGALLPETRNALEAMQKLYTDGLLDPEFGTRDYAKVNELIASGKLGICNGSFPAPLSQWQSLINNDENAEVAYYPIPNVEGGASSYVHDLGAQGYWVVTSGCEYPEAATMMLNVWMDVFYANTSDEVYREKVNWENGNETWQNAFVRAYRGFKNWDNYIQITAVLRDEKTADEITPEQRGNLEQCRQALAGDRTQWCWNAIFGEGGSCSIVDYYKNNDELFVQNAFTGNPTVSMVDYQALVDKLQLETFTKIVQGADISEFDSFVDQWNALGGADITAEVNEWKANQ